VSHPRIAFAVLAAMAAASSALAQTPAAPAKPPGAPAAPAPPAPKRAGLLWKEEWRQVGDGSEQAFDMAKAVRNPDLVMTLYGKEAVLRSLGKDGDENNPSHIFSGECKNACGVTFKSKSGMADLTGLARIRVNTKMSGFHKLYPMIKLASGDWYIGDRNPESSIRDWIVSDVAIPDVHWTKLDIANLVPKGNPVDKVDLTKVDEIGFVDLMPASGHGPGGWFDLAQIEVYGKPAAK